MAIRHERMFTEEEFWARGVDKREELVDGFIYAMATPSRLHQKILGFLFKKIANHIDAKKIPCEVYPAPFSVRLSKEKDTFLEPDITVICDPKKLTDRGCEGAPDFIIEIVSPSNPGHDYVLKLNLYEAAGVREYWIVDPERQHVLTYHLEAERFQCISHSFSDRIPVGICEDFEIDFSEITIS